MGQVFKGFWHGAELSLLHKACLQSFIQHGHRFELYAYRAVEAGQGVVLRDANAIIPEGEIFHFRNRDSNRPDIAPFSDLFRLKLLFEQGGWWSDVDNVCLTGAIPDCRYAWSRGCPRLEPEGVGNGLFACPKGDPLAAELYRRAQALGTQIRSREQLGSELISPLLKELGLPLDMSGDQTTFCPLAWVEIFKLWLPDYRDEVVAKTENALFLPLCGSVPPLLGIDMSRLPPEDSFLDLIIRKHGSCAPEWGPRYGRDEVLALTRAWFFGRARWAIEDLRIVAGEEMIEFLKGSAQSPPIQPDRSARRD